MILLNWLTFGGGISGTSAIGNVTAFVRVTVDVCNVNDVLISYRTVSLKLPLCLLVYIMLHMNPPPLPVNREGTELYIRPR